MLVVKRFDQLDTRELYEILRVRGLVFVVEQCCAYQDVDGEDARAYHVYEQQGDEIKAYLRVIPPNQPGEAAHIGRVLTLERGRGMAKALLREGIEIATKTLGACSIELEAQVYARGLYEKFGFQQVSEGFLLDGIEHMKMLRTSQDRELSG